MKRKGTVQPARRYNVISLLALVGFIGAGGYWFVSANQKPQTEYLYPVAVTRGTIEAIITAQGKLEPKEYVDVGTQVSGQLKHIHVNIGDTVQKGQLLAEIDPRVYQAQVEANAARLQSLRAQLHEQKAQTKLAQQVLTRNQNLFAVQAISQQVLQESEAQAAVAEARVGAITAQIKEVESNLQGNRTNLEFTKIYAPMAGTVTTMTAREGQTLNANQTAPIILQIADLDLMTVRAQVAEADVMRLQEGMSAYFMTLGDTEHRWEGKVRQILPAPDLLNDVVLYNILIDIKNTDRRLMTGMTTQVFFICAKAENVPTIPAEALSQYVPHEDNDTGKAYRIQVLTESGAEERLIHVGLQTRTQAHVTAGLDVGERILLKRPARSEVTNPSVRRDGAGRFSRGPQL